MEIGTRTHIFYIRLNINAKARMGWGTYGYKRNVSDPKNNS